MRLVLIDNYDSFSYNLYQLLASAGAELEVVRNDALSVAELMEGGFSGIVLSPGPGHPRDAGICEEVVRTLSGTLPILGVCLGHQAICEAFGGEIIYAPEILHGKQSLITTEGACPLFAGLDSRLSVGRYHSLAADEASLPCCLRVTARAEGGEVMAVSHAEHHTFGLQFHPESILTPAGPRMAENFLRLVALHATDGRE